MPSTKDAIKIFLRLKPHDGLQGGSTGDYEVEHSFDESHIKYHIDRRQAQDYGINSSKEDFSYRFDRIFDQKTKQDEVFDTVAKDCVQNVLGGYNSTVFAYGQTGSGKTFSITGGTASYADRGLIPRCISMIFDEIKKQPDVRYTVHISYLQIYNDKGQDLLNRGRDAESLDDLPTVTFHEGEEDLTLKGLDAHPAQSVQDALNLLFLGDTNRLYTETSMNKTSTRSHCIFSVMVEAREAGSSKVRRSKLNLVDLAGSERVGKTGVTGQLLTEAKYINLSLHYLEAVIVALSEKKPFIPYRNSFMTMVLRDSLGGNCKTSMLATGHLGEKFLLETISTCRFAQRVASIKQKATVNESSDPHVVIKQLKLEIAQLKDQIAFLSEGKDADPGRTLSADEITRCHEAVQKFLQDDDPTAQIVGVSSDLARVFGCFRILKNLCKGKNMSVMDQAVAATQNDGSRRGVEQNKGENSDGLGDSVAASSQRERELQEKIRHLQSAAQQKENELGLLFQVVQRHNAPKAHVETQTYDGDYESIRAHPHNSHPFVSQVQASESDPNAQHLTGAERPIGHSMLNSSIFAVMKSRNSDASQIHPVKQPSAHDVVAPTSAREQTFLAAERDRLAEGYELDTLSDPRLLTDRASAFEAFRKSYRNVEQIERTKAELDAKIPEAKRVAVNYNGTVDEIKAAKRKIQQLRAERALTGGPDSEPDEEEVELLARIRNELRPRLDADKRSLSELKERIDHIQLLVRRSSDQLVKDFDAWFTLRKRQVHGGGAVHSAAFSELPKSTQQYTPAATQTQSSTTQVMESSRPTSSSGSGAAAAHALVAAAPSVKRGSPYGSPPSTPPEPPTLTASQNLSTVSSASGHAATTRGGISSGDFFASNAGMISSRGGGNTSNASFRHTVGNPNGLPSINGGGSKHQHHHHTPSKHIMGGTFYASHGSAPSRIGPRDMDEEDAAIAADLAKMYQARDEMRSRWQRSQGGGAH